MGGMLQQQEKTQLGEKQSSECGGNWRNGRSQSAATDSDGHYLHFGPFRAYFSHPEVCSGKLNQQKKHPLMQQMHSIW